MVNCYIDTGNSIYDVQISLKNIHELLTPSKAITNTELQPMAESSPGQKYMLFSAGEGNTSFYLKRLLFKFWTFCVFEDPFGGLKTTYDDHLRLSGKRKDFLLVLTELFRLLLRLRCYERMSVQNWRLRSNRDG